MEQYSQSKKRGCPTCGGVDPKSCMRCHGKTKMCNWWNTDLGWDYFPPNQHNSPDAKSCALENTCDKSQHDFCDKLCSDYRAAD